MTISQELIKIFKKIKKHIVSVFYSYCGEFTVLADAVVISTHVTAIWLSRAS